MKFLIWISLILAVSQAPAQEQMADGVLIGADVMDHDLVNKVLKLSGKVQLVFQGQHLSADRAIMDQKKQQIIATGNVIMYSQRAHVEGDRLVFNYKQNTGFIYNGFVQSGQVIFEGSVVQKIGEDRYLATNAYYTACETCPAGWSFSGRTIDAEIGGYARIRRPVFKVGGIPVMILPGLIVPLKSSRQSGFLVPSLEVSGRGGAGLSESYFWAIDRSRDLTITPTYYQELGFKAHTDFRYVLSPESRGQLRSAWINDKKFPEENKFSGNFDRWFGWYTHHLEMPGGYVHRANIKAVSDLKYPRDFPLEIAGHGDPALTNHLSVAKLSDNHLASAQFEVYTNLLKESAIADNEDAVHRFPELRYAVKDTSILDTRLFFSLDANYINFARTHYSYDDLNTDPSTGNIAVGENGKLIRDGQFDPTTDRMRTGQRLDVRPRITYPFQIAKKFDVLPGISFRETQYNFTPPQAAQANGFSPSAARRYVQTDLAVRTEFTRIFGSSTDANATRYKHSIEPEVGYAYIPWSRRPNHPFFGDFEGLQYSRQYEPITDSDLAIGSNTGLQFDYEDRTYDKQVVDFGVTQRLTRKIMTNGNADYQTIGLFRLWQSYDINEANATTSPHPWSSVNALIDGRFEHFETYTTAAYNGYAKVTNLSSRLKFMKTAKNYLQLTYTQNYSLNSNYLITSATKNVGWGAGIMSKYVEAIGQFDYEARDLNLQSFTYRLNVKPPGNCWLISFEHHHVVNGDTSFRGAVSFDFGGENRNGLF